jgi:chromosome segregation ATPase
LIQDFAVNLGLFQELLQKITASTASGIISERLTPSEIWGKSESDVTTMRTLAEQMKKSMLVLKPERAPTIEKRSAALLQPLSKFKETLFKKGEHVPNSKTALEELRKAMIEGSSFLDLAKEIKNSPSEGIAAVLRLREVYDSKEYLSAIPVPEVTYVRFASLKNDIENLKVAISSLEHSLSELRTNLDGVIEEISKFRALPAEKTEEKRAEDEGPVEESGPEPSLVSKG